MALYTLADLHLSCSVDKPMDIFGGRWQDYMDKIRERWTALVEPEDVVVLVGDLSWAISIDSAKEDFIYLNQLPGHKILLKGNHDLWWNTMTKMNRFIEANGFANIQFLNNNCYVYEDIGLCGTRGWFFEEFFQEQHDEKIFRRELIRLESSLKAADALGVREKYCFLHYPPLHQNFRCDEILSLMKAYGVTRCIYGHLHGPSCRTATEGLHEGIEFTLVSGDHVDFTPVLLKK